MVVRGEEMGEKQSKYALTLTHPPHHQYAYIVALMPIKEARPCNTNHISTRESGEREDVRRELEGGNGSSHQHTAGGRIGNCLHPPPDETVFYGREKEYGTFLPH